jgi:GntR family transcriptional regulator
VAPTDHPAETGPFFVRLDSTDRTPIYGQIERGIRAAIATGRLPKGAQLPTVRQLAVDLAINPNTVAKVYSDLERNGVLETRRGVGTFVAEAAPAQPPREVSHQALRDFAARVLEDAAARGFSRDDFVAQLQLQLQEENRG